MPMPWSALSVIAVGLIGMFSAIRPWLDEVLPILQLPPDQKVPWSMRRRLLPWVILVAVFGVATILGLIVMAIWLIKQQTGA